MNSQSANIQLKQRLVGAIVLVALAVIFIPMLLPGEGELGGGIKGSNIPAEPDFRFPPVKKAPEAPPVADASLVPLGDEPADTKAETAVEPVKAEPAKAEPIKQAPPKPATKPVSKPAPKPTPTPKTTADKSGTASAWVVQVGSFSDRKNAQALRDKLRKQGYASFVESINGDAGRVYRVRVGPELSKAAADKLSTRLSKEAGLKGLVQVYP